jgi:hypothetical protein
MKRSSFKSVRLKRAVIIAIIVLAVSGIAYAVLQSRSVITGNTISTGSANLLISTDGVNYSHSIAGFNFDNILPSGYAAPAGGHSIYVKNTGRLPLSLRLAVDGSPSNPDGADLRQFNFALTDVSGATAPRGFILDLLVHGGLPVEGELAASATRHYQLQALAADDAPADVTISGIDLAFIGEARDPHQPPNE